MANIRLFLWFTLFAMLWLSYSQWRMDTAAPALVEQVGSAADPDAELPLLMTDDAPPQTPAADDPLPQAASASRLVSVRTDVLDLQIDTRGADLVQVDLPTYPVDKTEPDRIVRLLDHATDTRWLFQTGLRNLEGGPEANHLAEFSTEAASYELGASQQEMQVHFHWEGASGLTVRKTYTFRRGRFDIGLDIALRNSSDETWRGAGYSQMLRLHRPPDRSFTSVDSYSFTGPVLYDGEQYEKLDVDDLVDKPVSQSLAGGWLAGIQHHFLAAIVPPADELSTYRAATRGEEYVLSAVGPVADAPPGASFNYALKLFVGPKIQQQLRETANELELTVDYGILTILAKPLFWALDNIHDWVGNWGWSIVLVTVLIRLLFYKLTEMSGRSMAKMRKIAPRMKALQERYKDDRQAMSQAVMELYKKEKANPAAGCLPMLIQMPFFLAFYWVLLESVEMRQAPFMLWIADLSVRDPFFVLPLLMGAAMFFQSKLNPAPPDPVQAKVIQFMPLLFTGLFAFFPAGLVLYYMTNTVLGMLQQWRINTVIEREP